MKKGEIYEIRHSTVTGNYIIMRVCERILLADTLTPAEKLFCKTAKPKLDKGYIVYRKEK